MANFPLAIITDEFSQDFEKVCATAAELEIEGLELRTAWDKNVADMNDEEIAEIARLAKESGRRVLSIASPVYKCTLPDGGEIDHRFEQDAFHSAHAWEDQPRILARAVEVADRLGAPIVRVFSFWRTVEPEKTHDRIVEALERAVTVAAPRGVTIGLENEHACNLATGAEVEPVLKRVADLSVGLVWDPANALVAGEVPFPGGYRHIAVGSIIHVHAKDGVMDREKDRMQWGDLGAGDVDWNGQFAALVEDRYDGAISLETHWQGPGGDKFAGSVICAKSLKKLVAAA